MTRKVLLAVIPVVLLIVGWGVLSGYAQEESPAETERCRLLIVDETRTIGSSLRVEVLARALNQTGLFDLSAQIVAVDTGFENPLQDAVPDRDYNIILIIPRAIEHGTVKQLWVITRSFTEISPQLCAVIACLKETANAVFANVAEAIDVTEDLIPGFFAALFIKEEWL